MQKYITTKLIEAKPMKRGDFEEYHLSNRCHGFGDSLSVKNSNETMEEDGYFVRYPDGYESWCPKNVFEKTALKCEENDELPSGISVSEDMVYDFIHDMNKQTIGDKTTLVQVILNNGFEITETSSCVDPSCYDELLGASICMEKIENKIWELLGFLLQTAWKGVNGDR